MAQTVSPGTRGTALTLVTFAVVVGVLSVAPGVPSWLRPLQASTPAARQSLVAAVFKKPKMTLAEHEAAMEGKGGLRADGDMDHNADVDALPMSADDIAREDADLHDTTRAAADLLVLPSKAEDVVVAVDRAAMLDRVKDPRRGQLHQKHKALKMPGGQVENTCQNTLADGSCERRALDSFFATLDAIARGDGGARAAVVVLGNSLVASDHVTDIVRDSLTERFGDGGRGFLMVDRLAKHAGRRVRTGSGDVNWTIRSFMQDPPFPQGVRFGFSGALHEADKDNTTSRFQTNGATVAHLMWLNTGAPLTLEVDGKTWLEVPAETRTDEARDVEVRLPPLSRQVKLVAGQGARVFGVVLERERPGVIVDTIGVPAASAKLYTEAVDVDVFTSQLKSRAPALITVMLGGNETRSLAFGTNTPETIEAQFTTLLTRLHEAAPDASCLVVTPIDAGKTTTTDDTLITRPEIETVIAIEQKVAAAQGCAFFDLFAAMGGKGSLQRLRDAHMVSDDLVHPTARGGDVLGQLLADALLESYRTSPPNENAVVHRRESHEVGAPVFAGLSFPGEEQAVPVVVGRNDQARDTPRPLARFFSQLSGLDTRGGEVRRVAIGQFGASHTAGHMLTDRLRQRLGARFGDRGRGFVSVGRPSSRLKPSGVSRRLTGGFTIADGREVVSGGAVGMSGTKTRLEPGARFTIAFGQNIRPKAATTSGSLQLAWLYTPDMGTADVIVDGEIVATLSAAGRRTESDVQFLRVPFVHEPVQLEVEVHREQRVEPRTSRDAIVDGAMLETLGPVSLLGVSEELDRRGVIVDAVGLPGTTGMTPQRWRQDLYGEEVKARDYDLIVTAWGTNESGIASLDAATYKHHFGATLKTLLDASPRADCLIIGGSDRWDRRGDALVPAPAHDLVERVQRELASEFGCAYFSMAQAMGGRGAMKAWVAEGLGHEDHVHFTRKGYEKMADLIADDLLAAWRFRSTTGDADTVAAVPPTDAAMATNPDAAIDEKDEADALP